MRFLLLLTILAAKTNQDAMPTTIFINLNHKIYIS
jgi:hypothetical protein